jgi:hypothetical protein
MDICVYCGKPIKELPSLDGVPLHDNCMHAWEETKQIEREEKFTRDLLVGSFFKDLIVTVLRNAGYEVYPFGYESFLAGLKRPVYNAEPLRSETSERIRSAPDIIVLNREAGDLKLVEVKFRGRLLDDERADIYVNLYRKYWSESILVLVCPRGKIFYAQSIEKLTRENNQFPVDQDFLPLEEIFKRVSWERPVRKAFYAQLVRAIAKVR